MRHMAFALMLLGLVSPVSAQSVDPQSDSAFPPVTNTLSLAGPRFGITMLSDPIIAKLKERNIDVGSAISQFGWQFERAFYAKENGPTVLNEWVVLVGGLDQSVVIPSVSWLIGMRTKEGAEFGIGPNITPGGVALAVAAGVTFRAGIINVPLNFAVVPSKYGTRVSVLMGLMRRH